MNCKSTQLIGILKEAKATEKAWTSTPNDHLEKLNPVCQMEIHFPLSSAILVHNLQNLPQTATIEGLLSEFAGISLIEKANPEKIESYLYPLLSMYIIDAIFYNFTKEIKTIHKIAKKVYHIDTKFKTEIIKQICKLTNKKTSGKDQNDTRFLRFQNRNKTTASDIYNFALIWLQNERFYQIKKYANNLFGKVPDKEVINYILHQFGLVLERNIQVFFISKTNVEYFEYGTDKTQYASLTMLVNQKEECVYFLHSNKQCYDQYPYIFRRNETEHPHLPPYVLKAFGGQREEITEEFCKAFDLIEYSHKDYAELFKEFEICIVNVKRNKGNFKDIIRQLFRRMLSNSDPFLKEQVATVKDEIDKSDLLELLNAPDVCTTSPETEYESQIMQNEDCKDTGKEDGSSDNLSPFLLGKPQKMLSAVPRCIRKEEEKSEDLRESLFIVPKKAKSATTTRRKRHKDPREEQFANVKITNPVNSTVHVIKKTIV